MSLFQPVREIADKWNTFLSGMASAERVFSLLAWKSESDPSELRNPVSPIEGLQGKIVFENVWFAYEGDHWVLKDFCLEIQAGERIGVVGHTGAGKSTLIGLLLRFYEPQRGRILIDGKEIRNYDKRSLRASIGIVQQDVFLFSGTFQENITFWNSLNEEKARTFLDSIGFQKAYSSENLQERGSNLSLGERQIVAFARALAKDPKIWVLDEATSSLDSETEKLLQQSFERESIRKTTLIVAHRLSTVRNADRILVLHKGCLLEDGHHLDLMKKNGLYARLYRFQQAKSELPAPDQSHFV
jgi:ABC-type multidrug transport system fused ATPase/permease subunit